MEGYRLYAYLAALTAVGALMVLGEARLSWAAETVAVTSGRAEASQAEVAAIRTISGTVTAVVPDAKTLVVAEPRGKDALVVGASITEHTVIKEGRTKKRLEDLKVGDRVWMKFERVSSGDNAQMIVVKRSMK